MAQVQGEEIYLSHSGQEVDDNIDEVVAARGSEASLSARMAEIVGDFEADQQRQETEIGTVAALGAKNLLYISNAPGYTATSHGRTFTVLSDGGIKITGASSDSSNADFYIIGSWSNRSILLNENRDSCLMRMSCDTDYGYNQIRLKAMNRSTGSTVNETGVETNKDVQLSHVITTVFVSVFPSVTLPEDGIVVYPMIRRAEITDNTFVPYAPTNRELYEEKKQLQASIDQITGLEKQIPSNADLNAYSDPGVFQILSSAIAQTLVNIPADCKVAGSIEVKRLNGSARMQFYYPNWASSGTNPGSFYFRQRTGTTNWSAWYYFSGTQAASASAQSAPASLMQAGRIDAELTDAETGEEEEER